MEAAPLAPSLTVFRPATRFGSLFGAAVSLFCYGLTALLLGKALATDASSEQAYPIIGAMLFIGLGTLFAYWTWACLSLRYTVGGGDLEIRWGGLRQVIPLGQIERLVPGGESDQPQVEGVSWPGHYAGRAQVDTLGGVLFYSAHRSMSEVLYVETQEQTYAISVPDHLRFAEVVQDGQQYHQSSQRRQAAYRSGVAAQSFWLDGHARLLTAALFVSFAAVLVYVLSRYTGLPQSVPLRFPSLGGIVRVSDKSDLLDIPRSAAGFMTINFVLAVLLHNWERMVAYVLLLAAIAIQIMLLVAAIVAVA